MKKRGLEVCAHCGEFPCKKFDNATEGPDFKTTSQKIMENQNYIQSSGITRFLEQQVERMKALQVMLEFYNDGRSKTFYCLAATLLSLKSLQAALTKAGQEITNQSIRENDMKSKGKILKGILHKFSQEENEVLKMRKK